MKTKEEIKIRIEQEERYTARIIKEAIEKFQEDSDTSHLIVPSRLKDSSDDRVDILKWVLGLSNSEDVTS